MVARRLGDDLPPRLSPWEVVGAWLHLWTPPRGARVPPVPVRKLLMWTAGVLVVLAAGAAVIGPLVDAGKRRSAAADARERAAALAERARTLRRQQAAHTGSGPAAPAALSPERRLRRRTALVRSVEAAILADAAVRHERGELAQEAGRVDCERHPKAISAPAPERVLGEPRGAYTCLARVSAITGAGQSGSLGYPFRAILDFAAGRYAFCRIHPVPGEQVLPDPRAVVPLPRACRVR
jgi:hypothetical protein